MVDEERVDTREKLEADVRNVMSQWYFETGWSGNTSRGLEESVVMRWLDRQAAITEHEFNDRCKECGWRYLAAQPDQEAYDEIVRLKDELAKRDKGIERLRRRRGELTDQVRLLTDKVARLERQSEKADELSIEVADFAELRECMCDELEVVKGQRDEARAEAEFYRFKLGRVLDAIHEIEREVRNG